MSTKIVKKLSKKLNTKYFMFMSNEININYHYTLKLAQELKKSNIFQAPCVRRL